MNIKQKMERLQMVKAMEYIARCVNDDEIFEGWLTSGVADGDILFGEVAVKTDDLESLYYYIEDENFVELMECFLRVMARAKKCGGLYCGGLSGGEC